jgi:hypothetical protein
MTVMRAVMITLAATIIIVLIAIMFSGQAQADTVIYPTIPGTSYRDYSRSGVLVEQEGDKTVYYRTLPGTDYKDYSRPGWVVEGGAAYPTIPGTPSIDYNRSGWGSHGR